MYGPAVRCKRTFIELADVRSCINVSGLCLEHVVSGPSCAIEVLLLIPLHLHDRDDGRRLLELTAEQHRIAAMRAAALGQDYRALEQTRNIFYQALVGGEVLEITKMVSPTGHGTRSGKWDRNNRQW